jgi:hypothetical protein
MARIIFYSDMPEREEGNTGGNVEEHEAESMGSAPESKNDKANAPDAISHTPAALRLTEQDAETKEPTQGASYPPKRSQHVVRRCKAIVSGMLLKIEKGIAFLDRHNGVVTALATLAIACFTYNYTSYAQRQWITMHAQLGEMHSSSAQTDRLIAAATIQSEAAKLSAETAQQALKISERSIELAQESLRLDQRAWVVVKEMLCSNLTEGQPVTAKITITNTGKTPANAIMTASIALLQSMQEPMPIYPMKRPPSNSLVTPGGTFAIFVTTDQPLTTDRMRLLQSEDLTIYIWGNIMFEDGFGKYETLFCGLYSPDEHNIVFCPTNNIIKTK